MSTDQHSANSTEACGSATRVEIPFAIWFGTLLAVATALRTFTLGSKSFWLDEAASTMLAHSDWHTFLIALTHRQANMTLYYLLLRGWMVFGNSETFVRTLSVLFGVAAVAVMYQLANRVFSQKTARVAALLLSVHQFHIQYSQEARGYSLATLLALLSCYWFVGLLLPGVRRTRAYILASVLLVYAHVFGIWILLAQWLYAAVCAKSSVRRGLIKAVVTILLSVSPLAVSLFFLSSRSQLSWINQSSVSSVYRTLLDFSGNAGNSLLILEVALLFGSVFFFFRENSLTVSRSTYPFLWIWLLLPIVIVGAASLHWPLLQPRYLIVCLPPFLLLVADGLVRITWRVLAVVALMVVLALSLAASSIYFRQRTGLATDDWRDATRYFCLKAQPGDAVLFPYSAEEIAFREYQHRFCNLKPQITLLPQKTDLDLLAEPGNWASLELTSSAAGEHPRVWVITALQPSATSRSVGAELSRTLKEESRQSFGFVTTQLFARAPGEPH